MRSTPLENICINNCWPHPDRLDRRSGWLSDQADAAQEPGCAGRIGFGAGSLHLTDVEVEEHGMWTDAREGLLVFPRSASAQVRSTDPLERVNGTIRRRTDILRIFPFVHLAT